MHCNPYNKTKLNAVDPYLFDKKFSKQFSTKLLHEYIKFLKVSCNSSLNSRIN